MLIGKFILNILVFSRLYPGSVSENIFVTNCCLFLQIRDFSNYWLSNFQNEIPHLYE